MDNGAGDGDGDSCGSISWQIVDPEKDEDTWKLMRGEKEDMKGRRLNIAYHANWV